MAKKILVVDDEENIRHLLADELTEDGYSVVAVGSGESALDALKADGPFDLVTLDIKMPGMGGIAALRAIREGTPAVPIIVLTAYSEFKSDFDVWSADAYVRKSSDLAELKKMISYLLMPGKGCKDYCRNKR